MGKEWKLAKYKTVMNRSEMPKEYRKSINMKVQSVDKDAYSELSKIKDNITSFVNSGKNVLIHSKTVGCGKTTWACELAKQYVIDNIELNPSILYVNVPTLLNDIKISFDDIEYKAKTIEIQKRIKTEKLVIFDDIGVKDLSEYDKNIVYSWVNSRVVENKTSIYTTNISIDDIDKCMGERIADRILGYSKVIEFNGGSFRGVA